MFKNVAPIQPLLSPSAAKAIWQVTNNEWVNFLGDLAGSGKILLEVNVGREVTSPDQSGVFWRVPQPVT